MRLVKKMKTIKIKNSYQMWNPRIMKSLIMLACLRKYGVVNANKILNRTYLFMCVEWYLHNVGYYVTLPFVGNNQMYFLNERFKDVDLEVK